MSKYNETHHRAARIDVRGGPGSETFPVTLSTEQPVERWGAAEILSHTPEAVNLERAEDGLPLLWNHSTDQFIGVVRNIRLEKKKLKGELSFSHSTRGQEVAGDVAAGLIKNISIGYRIDEYTEDDKARTITADRWTIYEASVTPIPADHTAGINREATTMTTTKENTPEKPETKTRSKKESTPATDARQAEVQRIASIRQLFGDRWTAPEHLDLMTQAINDGMTLDQCRGELLTLIGATHGPVNQENPPRDHGTPEDFTQRMEESIRVRAGIETDPKIITHCRDHNEFGGLSLVELAREYMRRTGQQSRGDARSIVGRAFTTRAAGATADFPEILANVAFSSLLKAYWDAPETWRSWASTSSLNDFKLNHRVNISEFDTLPIVPEGGTYTEGSFTDLGEEIQLATYGKIYQITREAIINDSLAAFTRIPTAMGLAAARTVGNLVYGVLTGNPTMKQDAKTLFHADHNNLVAIGAPPDVDSIQAAKVAMALQQGPKGEATLGIMPRFAICPVELEGVLNTLMASQYNPASDAGTLEPNIVQNLLTVVSDHRLSADSPAAWYIAADPASWDTVEVAFLNGAQAPYQERRQQDISNDSITYKVRIDAAAAPLDFRGLYKNAGA